MAASWGVLLAAFGGVCAAVLLLLTLGNTASRAVQRWRWLQSLLLRALQVGGDVPRHVAIIMDGNRRWARERRLRTEEGHRFGGDTMINTLRWSLDAGVRTITLYAFSLENFKRPQHEVDTIMRLAEDNLAIMLTPGSIIKQRRVKVRFCGELELLPSRVRSLASAVADMTAEYDGPRMNICLAYTSRQEIASAVAAVCAAVHAGRLSADDVHESVLDALMHSSDADADGGGGAADDDDERPPDVLIRTSGEKRMSDFLLWQLRHTHLAFVDVLWPDFGAWDYARIVLDYQRCRADGRRKAAACRAGGVAGEPEFSAARRRAAVAAVREYVDELSGADEAGSEHDLGSSSPTTAAESCARGGRTTCDSLYSLDISLTSSAEASEGDEGAEEPIEREIGRSLHKRTALTSSTSAKRELPALIN